MSLTTVIVVNAVPALGILAALTAVMRIPFRLDRHTAADIVAVPAAPQPVELAA
jgi:hypothetical protein